MARTASVRGSVVTSAAHSVIQGAITSSGYRSTVVPSDVSKLDDADVCAGGSAVVGVATLRTGILLDTRPADRDRPTPTRSSDGITNADETMAEITKTYRSARNGDWLVNTGHHGRRGFLSSTRRPRPCH